MDPIVTVKKIKEKSSSLHPVMHFRTITKHRNLVCKYCLRLGLIKQGLTHDLSKYTPVEFWRGVKYYQGNRSPNDAERRQTGVSKAWLHHKGRNKHHFEYWTDYSIEAAKRGDYPVKSVQMPRRYVAEMLMDRIAASKTYMKENYTDASPLEYYERGKAGKLMHPDTARELEAMLRILAKKGEQECFRFVKEYYLRGYPVIKKQRQEK